MKNLFKNRYAFILVGDGEIGKSALMKNLIDNLNQVQYNGHVRTSFDHPIKQAKVEYDYNWNTIVCSHSFYCEQNTEVITTMEGYLQNLQAQFVLVPEQMFCLPKLVSKLSDHNYLTTCYHIWINDDIRYITINGQKFELGDLNSSQYKDNIQRIKEDMYRVIISIS